MVPAVHSFSIENNVNSLTGQPFGSAYAGKFSVRRPSLADKQLIAIKKAAIMSVFGYANEEMIRPGIRLTIHIYAHMTVTSTEELPKWFDPEKMHEDSDEQAMFSVSEEVNRWLDTFRPKANPAPGSEGSEEPPVLVSAEV